MKEVTKQKEVTGQKETIKEKNKIKGDLPLVPKGEKPMRLDAKVRELFEISWGEARERIYRGKIFINEKACTDIAESVRPNDEVRFVAEARRLKPEDELLPKEAFRWIDRDIVVVEKPADLLTVPYEPEDKLTLDRLIQAVLAKREKHQSRGSRAARPPIFVVHRLDRGTSGLLVFARNPDARDGLKDQFREHSAERRYLAIAHGKVKSQRFETRQVQDRGDGIRGSIEEAPLRMQKKLGQGKLAVTNVEALEVLAGGEATLISCRLETGRTNQIRIHLSEAGHPLVGETVYLRSYKGEVIPASRLCLHAETLGFVHPKTGEKMRFTCPPPLEMQQVVKQLRRKKNSSKK